MPPVVAIAASFAPVLRPAGLNHGMVGRDSCVVMRSPRLSPPIAPEVVEAARLSASCHLLP
jgi:hypothetical protein